MKIYRTFFRAKQVGEKEREISICLRNCSQGSCSYIDLPQFPSNLNKRLTPLMLTLNQRLRSPQDAYGTSGLKSSIKLRKIKSAITKAPKVCALIFNNHLQYTEMIYLLIFSIIICFEF